MADRTYRRNDRDRFDRDYSRQAEQFDNTDYSWRDDERSYGQMGEGSWRDDEQSTRGRTYSRSRDFSRDQSYSRGGDYGRSEPSAYTSSRYASNPYAPDQTPGFAPFTGSDQGGRDFNQPRYTGRSHSGEYGGYGAGTMLAQNRGEWREDGRSSTAYHGRNDERGWLERASDEVAGWFGGSESDDRRESYRGHGPSGYTRSDERIREDVNDALTDDWRVDARKIQVSVSKGEVTLDGTVPSRDHKRRAEDVVEDLSGVKHVQNNLRVEESSSWNRSSTSETNAKTSGAI